MLVEFRHWVCRLGMFLELGEFDKSWVTKRASITKAVRVRPFLIYSRQVTQIRVSRNNVGMELKNSNVSQMSCISITLMHEVHTVDRAAFNR